MADNVSALQRAVAWRAENPAAYDMMMKWARRDLKYQRHGAVRFYAELLRRPEFHGAHGTSSERVSYLVDNRILSSLARMLMQDDPRLAGVLAIRYCRDLDEPQPGNATPEPRWIETR